MFLSSTARQLVGVVVGNTQASSVMPVVSRREVEFGIVTCAPVPLNTSALPNLPAVVQLAPPIVPVLPLPERSVTAVPAPSLKPYAATRPLACVLATVTVTLVAVVAFPPASRARAESVCDPLPAEAVFQASEYGPVCSAPSDTPSSRN